MFVTWHLCFYLNYCELQNDGKIRDVNKNTKSQQKIYEQINILIYFFLLINTIHRQTLPT